jgi:hypothetical protein
MIAAGVPVATGSDGPMNPYLNVMFASINANNPAQAMTREQAITAYTFGLGAGRDDGNPEGDDLAENARGYLDAVAGHLHRAPDALPATVQRADARRPGWSCTSKK